jgi:hypothetical protein
MLFKRTNGNTQGPLWDIEEFEIEHLTSLIGGKKMEMNDL